MTHDHHTHHVELSGAAGSPLFVEVVRGGMVESVHRGRACIVDASGHVHAHWGDIKAPIYPRSAVKPLQAIPLVECGALDAFKLTDAELALACASHTGESRHTRMISAWLDRIDCSVDDLECGPQAPTDDETANELIRQAEEPSALHNNCSGKHAGFLTTARHKGEPIKGYSRFDHPVQQRIMGVLEQMTGQDLSMLPWGVDGCGIPSFAMPLEALAYAMAKLASPHALPDRRAEAAARIRVAWAAHAYLIGGRGSFDTEMMKLATGHVLLKSGAEGVAVAVLPRQNLGIAVKIDDGAARARDIAIANLLRIADALGTEHWTRAEHLMRRTLRNCGGREVGMIRPAEGWPEPDETETAPE